MKQVVPAADTSRTEYVMIRDASTGLPKTGLAYNTASLTAYYVLELAAAAAITLATQTVTGAWSSGGFVEVDATNAKGLYRFDVPNAVFASGKKSFVVIQLTGTIIPVTLEYQLGTVPADTAKWNGTAVATPATAGIVEVNIKRINDSNAAAIRLAKSAGVIVPGTVATAGFSPTTTEFEASDITEATADHYKNRVVIFTSGALTEQAAAITAYALSGGRGHFTVSAMTEAPADTNTFIVI